MLNPIFPRSAFVGLGGDFTSLYAENIESPPEFLLTAFYTCFGIAIAPHVTLDLAFDTPPRLYTVCLGDSATPRKSTAIKLATGFFSQNGEAPFRTLYGLGSIEGFARDFNGRNRKLKELGDKRPTLLCYDELQAFVAKAGQRGSILLPAISTLFESDSYDNPTIRQRVELRGCHLAMLSACTIDTYADMWTSEFTSIGLPNRLFIVVGERSKQIALPKSPETGSPERLFQKVQETIARVKQEAGSGKLRLSLTPEAEQRWTRYYEQMDSSIHAKRLDTYGFRWMVLFSVGRGDKQVSRDTVDRVCDLLDYQFAVRKLYDPINADNVIAKMEEKIRRVIQPEQGYSVRTLQQRTNANRTGLWAFRTAINNLKAAGEIEQGKDGDLRLVVNSVVRRLETDKLLEINREAAVLA